MPPAVVTVSWSFVVLKLAAVTAVPAKSMALVGVVGLLATVMPAMVPLNPCWAALFARSRMPVPPRNVVASPEATVPASSSVEVLVLATSRPVTFAAVMLLVMSRIPPLASTTPAPESAPVIVPSPLIVAPELLTMPLPPLELRVPPERVIVPPELSVMVVVELRVSPLAMVIAAELVMPLLAVMLPPVTAIVALLLLVTAPVNVP